MTTSERNYKQAKGIFSDISDDFYEIENNSETTNDSYLIDQTLEDIKRVNRHLNRVHIEELEDEYDPEVVDVLEKNIQHMREGSYYIERSLMSMKLFDKLQPVLDKYIGNADWENIADSKEDAITKFGRFLTSEDNYEMYRTIINNIVKGTMKQKQFSELFDKLKSRMSKPKEERKPQRHPLPPEMYPEKQRKEWEKEKGKNKKFAVDDETEEFDIMGENFIGIERYKKLFESLAYYCATCGERAEHEEIEDNPRMTCSNCGDSNWEQEY